MSWVLIYVVIEIVPKYRLTVTLLKTPFCIAVLHRQCKWVLCKHGNPWWVLIFIEVRSGYKPNNSRDQYLFYDAHYFAGTIELTKVRYLKFPSNIESIASGANGCAPIAIVFLPRKEIVPKKIRILSLRTDEINSTNNTIYQ